MSIKIERMAAWLVCLGLALVGATAAAPTSRTPGRQFPVGSLGRLEELPAGRFRTRLDRLPAEARQRALSWLRSFHFAEEDLATLHADEGGGIYYADPAADPALGLADVAGPETAGAAVAVSPFPAGLVFHSRPGAPNVVYLDFDGETVAGTEWNTSLGRTEIPVLAFSIDTDRATFSDDEQLAIRRIWERVAEDYAPFNVDVTTERPAVFGNRTAHALVTRSTDANGAPNPASGSGGVAYVNVFGTTSYARYRPAWIYADNLAGNEGFVAEAVSHEVGHNLGLSHDGTTGGSEYYGGHGSGETSWGPLMGTGYNRNVSQWSKGDYYQANNQQDDLAIVAGKITYRTDDHGNTSGTATALVLSGGTNVVATTPATDPANLVRANKGVIERNTDVDVFSFVTGNGPVNLTVSPWIVPLAATRGGNLDVRLRLFDEAGLLLQTVEPLDRTAASLVATLPAGRYFLHVGNAGSGDPLNAAPSGYTAYGSLGQYFIQGFVTASAGLVLPPVAALQVAGIEASGQGALPLTVTYGDDVAVSVATIDGNDLRVTGPNGFLRWARFVSVNASGDGTPRVATYAVDPPAGGSWVPADNGVYSVDMEPRQVADTGGAWAAPGRLGQFSVAVPVAFYTANLEADPGWTLEPDWAFGIPSYGAAGPAAGFTGTRVIGYNLGGNYPNRLATKYATTPAINTAGSANLSLRFRRWLRVQNGDTALVEVSTNGTAWSRLWIASQRVADTAWQRVEYPLPPGFAGSRSLQVRWGMGSNPSQTDIGWNLDDIEVLGDGTPDADPPSAVLSVADLTVAGSPSQACSVTYTDAAAVRLGSLDSSDLVVAGPNGFVGAVEFVGADLPADGTSITASYSIPAPGGIWDAADNGVYELVLAAGEVTDIHDNATPRTVLGSFTVALPTDDQAIVVAPVAVTVPEGGEAVFTVRLAAPPADAVAVTTLWVGGDPSVVVHDGARLDFTPANWSTPVTVTLRAEPDADQENSSATFECRAVGLVPVTILATKEEVAPGTLGILWPDVPLFVGPAGGPFVPDSLACVLTNSGASSLEWVIGKTADWLSVSAPAGTLEPHAEIRIDLSLDPAAHALPDGMFDGVLGFTNLTSGIGTATRAFFLAVGPQALVRLEVAVNEPTWGSVSPAGGSYPTGLPLELRATPATHFEFREWRGDVASTANPLSVLLAESRSVEAVFAELLTANQPTPLWWLAAHGVAGDFEDAVLRPGANGLPLWQSYQAGLDPDDPGSQLRLAGKMAADGAAFVLDWSPVADRLYSLWTGSSSLAELAPLPDAQDLPWTVHGFTNVVQSEAPARFYQLRVRKP